MAFFSRQSQTPQTSIGSLFSHDANVSTTDPLQPLRAMADRVGKEVEKFAERVDHWHMHGNEAEKTRYHSTVKMVGQFKDVAEATVRDLKKKHGSVNEDQLNKSVRRRIKNVAPESTSRAISILGQSVVPSIEGSGGPGSSVEELRHWQAELATWELVQVMIDLYHPEPGTDVEAEKERKLKEVGGTHRFCPKNEVWERFMLTDHMAKEKKLVLEWLQKTAKNTESNTESIINQWGEISGKDTNTWTSGWLDTKTKIKQVKMAQGLDHPLDPNAIVQGSEVNQVLIAHMDPDAPLRQKRGIAKSDEYYENALWMVCYEMLRRGESWEKISDWFRERNEAWRGVSIGASGETQVPGAPNMAGSDFGYLFRRMCLAAGRGARFPYEGAVYALLCGDYNLVHALTRSWDDHLYAYYNALLLSRFDSFLLKEPESDPWVSQRLGQQFVVPDVVDALGNWETATRKVMNLLQKSGTTSEEARRPMKLIQAALIDQTLDDLMHKVGVAIADVIRPQNDNLILDPYILDRSEEVEHPVKAEDFHRAFAYDLQALRVLVHVSIVFGNGLSPMKDEPRPRRYAIDNVFAAYVEFLRMTKRIQIIPLYAMQMSEGRSSLTFGRILPEIKNHEEQKHYIKLLEHYRIDVEGALVGAYQIVMDDTSFVDANDNFTTPATGYVALEMQTGPDQYLWPGGYRIKSTMPGFDISPPEEALIEILQWYNHLEKSDTLFQLLTRALITFLHCGRMGAAERLVAEMSVEKISLLKTPFYCGYAFDFTQPGTEEQDGEQVAEYMHESLRGSGRDSLRPSEIPSAQEHTEKVLWLRRETQVYFSLSQIVRLISLFREWRKEEDKLIRQRNSAQQVSTTNIKELFKSIEVAFPSTLDFPRIMEDSDDPTPLGNEIEELYRNYIPEIVIGYMSVLQAGSFFIHRDSAVKAMDLVVAIADDERSWLQQLFMQTKRMRELVNRITDVSKAIIKLGEHGIGKDKDKVGKKRGNKGETLGIWDTGITYEYLSGLPYRD